MSPKVVGGRPPVFLNHLFFAGCQLRGAVWHLNLVKLGQPLVEVRSNMHFAAVLFPCPPVLFSFRWAIEGANHKKSERE